MMSIKGCAVQYPVGVSSEMHLEDGKQGRKRDRHNLSKRLPLVLVLELVLAREQPQHEHAAIQLPVILCTSGVATCVVIWQPPWQMLGQEAAAAVGDMVLPGFAECCMLTGCMAIACKPSNY